jgi:hypothetical protein
LSGSRLGHFFETAPWWDQSGYLGPGLWLVTAFFAWSCWRTQRGKFLILTVAVIAIMSLGPVLHSAAEQLIAMPWRLFNALPLMDEALPGRFGMYLCLVTAVIAAIYLAQASTPVWWRALLGGLSLLFILPDLAVWRQPGHNPAYLRTPAHTIVQVPEFFRSGQYKRFVGPGDNLLILPLGGGSNASLLWQAQSDFYFNNISWYGAIAPPDADRWPVMTTFHSEDKIFDFTEQLDAFLGAHQVKAIVVDLNATRRWPDLLAHTGMTPIGADGVLFYKVPRQVLVSFRSATPHEMAVKEAAAAFSVLLDAGCRYVDAGFPLDKLTPGEAQRRKLLTLPDSERTPEIGSDPYWWQNLWLGSWGGLVGVGIAGNYQDLAFLIHDYGPEASKIFFPYPKGLSRRRHGEQGLLLIMFKPEGMKRTAQKNGLRCGASAT